ncbi:MAG: hypothetical protein LBG58_10570, partial [Planctomycetaceae bacterium]|nr:hypothetical protein [Planctomycetaceae bacterium]
KTLLEFIGVFAVFYIFGAWPVPDSNEPYYIGKAIHFWNPDWIPNDPFLESKDSHWTFYVVFGWLSFFLSPDAMAWTGRFLTWGLLALSWLRLSFTLVPVRWMSIPTAWALAYYIDSFHAAGEWILGGVEGKSFAFPLVFFGLESMLRGRWHRTWIFLGAASAFHVLVGGWSVLVAGLVFLPDRRTTNSSRNVAQRFTVPWGLFVGGMLALFGLIPALLLDYGVATDTVREAHQIYVFERLHHHLVPYQFSWTYLVRFILLAVIWIAMCRFGQQRNQRQIRFERFIWGTLILFLIGMSAAYGLHNNRILSAEILRFYWFRLSDVFIPVGVAVGALRHFLAMVQKVKKTQKTQNIPKVQTTQTVQTAHTVQNFQIRESGLPFPPISGWLILFGVPFCVYLFFDALIFSRRIYFSTAVESGIPWALTILVCWGILVFSKRFLHFSHFSHFSHSLRSLHHCTGFTTFLVWGFIGLYAVILFYAPFESLKTLGDVRTSMAYSRIEPGRSHIAYYWINACRWIADPQNTPQTAKFWIPREGTTFKWHAQRSDIGTWKNVPQDAEGIVRWQQMMHDLFYYRNREGQLCDDRSLSVLLWWKTEAEIEQLRIRYGFDYILCPAYPELSHHKTFQVVYANDFYKVYRIFPFGEEKRARQRLSFAPSEPVNLPITD